MTLTMLLILGPICGLALFLIARTARHPARPIQTPQQAALILGAANLAILLLTAAVTFVPGGVPLAAIGGPLLSFGAWTYLGRAMSFTGKPRWIATLAGMSPYLLLIAGAAWWLSSLPAVDPPGEDSFHAWLGASILLAVGAGAFSLGSLTTGLTRRRCAP
jgi:hypothetical protein